jgi:hypothetical protein
MEMANVILPGVYITVRDEGLITVGGVSTGNVGIVGTALEGPINKVQTPGSFAEAQALFDGKAGTDYKAATPPPDKVTLLRSLELLFANGASSVYAVRADAETADSYGTALDILSNEIVNIVLLAGQDGTKKDMMAKLTAHISSTESILRERIAVAGCNGSVDVDAINAGKVVNDSGRVVYVAPGVKTSRRDPATGQTTTTTLSGAYSAAAFAGLLASIPVQVSPTNKVLNVSDLAANFNHTQLEKLVQQNIVAVESREGFRVVKGVTTSTNTAWRQITTRRIVDYAIYGTRAACDPYIGKLNNERVRGAMKATLDGFLTRMVESESLTGYTLDVTATRANEIAGQAIVNMTIQPTFSIDYIMVTMTLG